MKSFQSFRLDTPNHSLWRENDRVAIAPKAYDVLRFLVENAGRLVAHEEIIRAIWPDTFVNPEVVRKYIQDIRRILGDRAEKPMFIETVTKRGYRFVATVVDQDALEALPESQLTIPVYNPPQLQPVRSLMSANYASTMWVPVCCGRVMRCNMFRQPDGSSYAALVCAVCNKNITLEQEPSSAAENFGEGSSILNVIGSPRPPKTERQKPLANPGEDDPTL